MKELRVRVIVTMKEVVDDSQGRQVLASLNRRSFNEVTSVRQGKVFDLVIETNNPNGVEEYVKRACHELLVDPNVESLDSIVVEDGGDQE